MTWPAALPFGCDMLYRQYGNMEPIVASYPALKKWLEHMLQTYGRDGILTLDRYADLVRATREADHHTAGKDPARQTSGELIATAYGVRVMQLMEKFAALQHLDDDAALWKARHTAMADAFNRRFLTVRRGTSPRPGHVLYPDSVFMATIPPRPTCCRWPLALCPTA
jgi:alpha-L-rhamnosidase